MKLFHLTVSKCPSLHDNDIVFINWAENVYSGLFYTTIIEYELVTI